MFHCRTGPGENFFSCALHFFFGILLINSPCLFCRFANRLTGIKENEKFQKSGKKEEQSDQEGVGLKHVVQEAKQRHNVK